MEALIINYTDLMGFLHFSSFNQTRNLKQTSKTSQITVKILQRAARWLTLRFPFFRTLHTRSVDDLIKTRVLFKLRSVDALTVFIIRELWWEWCMACNLPQTGTATTIRPRSHQTSSQVHGWCISNDPLYQSLNLTSPKPENPITGVFMWLES